MKLYVDYVNNFDESIKLYKSLEDNKSWLNFNKTALSTSGMKLDLPNILITPIQRGPRYELLLTQLLKFTPVNHKDYQSLIDAKDLVMKENKYIDEKKKEHENKLKILRIQQNVQTLPGAKLILASPNRLYVKEGTLEFSFNESVEKGPVYVLSDMVLLTKHVNEGETVTQIIHPEKRRNPIFMGIPLLGLAKTFTPYSQLPHHQQSNPLSKSSSNTTSTTTTSNHPVLSLGIPLISPRSSSRPTSPRESEPVDNSVPKSQLNVTPTTTVATNSGPFFLDVIPFKDLEVRDIGPYQFNLHQREDVWEFYCSNEETKTEWMNTLNTAIQTYLLFTIIDGTTENDYEKGFAVVGGTYGCIESEHDEDTVDVTEQLKKVTKQQGGGQLIIDEGTKVPLFGIDPCPTKEKTLVILYSINGNVKSKHYKDVEPVELNAHS
eukprot:TRINITY_DN3008_c0_g1_i1.p1 TRINITY_DN3008_c0_g1~~TRINITY_DN3008_c0_g1_i1.p1  ORF type:complete len:435 (-),score=115.83 TRINITY_DN3008_c0_g1_i1:114-1418(-)